MQFINIHDAKTNLSKYLSQLQASSETIVICKNGEPIAQLTAYQKPNKRILGLWKGKVKISSDFDELPDKFRSYFE